MKEKLYNLIKEIEFFKNIESIVEIKGGYSGASTFCVVDSNGKYFVKFRNSFICNLKENFEIFSKACNVANILSYGETDGLIYFITEFIEGDTLKHFYSILSKKEVYNLGKHVGREQNHISNIKKTKINNDFFKNFKQFTLSEINSYTENFIQHKQFINTQAFTFLELLFSKINNEKEILVEIFKNQPLYYCHSDIKVGNFMLSKNILYTVDYEDSDYHYLAYHLRSDFYNAIENYPVKPKTWHFIKGFLDSFFKNQIPAEFYLQLKYIFFFSLTRRVSKRIQERNYTEVEKIAFNLEKNFIDFKSIDNLFNFSTLADCVK